MTPERMRVRIAEYLGWVQVFVGANGDLFGCNPSTNSFDCVPDFPRCLNACAVMEKSLPDDPIAETPERAKYKVLLARTCRGSKVDSVFSTAHQRCTAFCRTVGIWEDEPTEQSPTRITVPPVAGRNVEQSL